MDKPIYLDYNATTPVDERVLEDMLPYFRQEFGNAASKTHPYGWMAEEAVHQARMAVASLIGCTEQEIVFTSGATEAINLGIKGLAQTYSRKGKHIITASTEHKAVLDSCKSLERQGYEVSYLPVMKSGLIDLALLESAITDQTILVCIMIANNETGVIQPIRDIANIVHSKGSIFMSDAVQAIGKIPVDVNDLGIDLMPISAHKCYGPKGVGALYVRRRNPRVKLASLIDGGGHERGMRSGTLNVPGIVGLGRAVEIVKEELSEDMERMATLRDQFERALLTAVAARINGDPNVRLPNVSNICFPGIKSEQLLMSMSNLAVSTGSACTSADMKPSHVLQAMGLSLEDAYSSIRFSLGKMTTEAEIEQIIPYVVENINKLKTTSVLQG